MDNTKSTEPTRPAESSCPSKALGDPVDMFWTSTHSTTTSSSMSQVSSNSASRCPYHECTCHKDLHHYSFRGTSSSNEEAGSSSPSNSTTADLDGGDSCDEQAAYPPVPDQMLSTDETAYPIADRNALGDGSFKANLDILDVGAIWPNGSSRNVVMGIAAKAGALCELLQWEDNSRPTNVDSEKLKDNLADLFLYIRLMADMWKVDLVNEAMKKLSKD